MKPVPGLEHVVIAIDGYSSCGKSTVARALAKSLGIRYIDSGAMYRAVTLYFLRHGVPFSLSGAANGVDYAPYLDKIKISFKVNPEDGSSEIFLNGSKVEQEIRSMEVSENVSHVSAIPAVRKRMVEMQQHLKGEGGLVMDGRDIGTTVFPEADLKIFMTADSEIRSGRRFKELLSKGVAVTLDEVRNNINSRDYEDTHRSESPLRKAEDAVVLDNTHLDFDEQVNFVLEKLRNLQSVN